MEKAGFHRAGALIEVARVLVQQRGKHRVAKQDLGVAAGSSDAKALAKAFGVLTEARIAGRLIDCSVQAKPAIVTGSVNVRSAS